MTEVKLDVIEQVMETLEDDAGEDWYWPGCDEIASAILGEVDCLLAGFYD